MLVWRQINTGARPVPLPAPAAVVWSTVGVGAALLMSLLTALNANDQSGVALAAVCALAALAGLRGRLVAAPGTALVCWLFLNTFATAPTGQVSWAAHRDSSWLILLLAATALGTITARLAQARAAYRRISPGHSPGITAEDPPEITCSKSR